MWKEVGFFFISFLIWIFPIVLVNSFSWFAFLIMKNITNATKHPFLLYMILIWKDSFFLHSKLPFELKKIVFNLEVWKIVDVKLWINLFSQLNFPLGESSFQFPNLPFFSKHLVQFFFYRKCSVLKKRKPWLFTWLSFCVVIDKWV